jgi:hypothetical protein
MASAGRCPDVCRAHAGRGCSAAVAEHLARELARLRELERAALEFCERCERGEIRSSYSYRRFRAALDGRSKTRRTLSPGDA